jgi:heat shock protein HslJ
MKKVFLSVAIVCLAFVSCNSTKSTANDVSSLEGAWELNYITGPRITFEGLYPDNKPTISFDVKENKISGNSSCNNFMGPLSVEENKIDFKDSKIAMTMMACQGSGEGVFMSTLEKVETYKVSEDGKTLSFIMGDVEMMRFTKK